jgi:hypothetical protein
MTGFKRAKKLYRQFLDFIIFLKSFFLF